MNRNVSRETIVCGAAGLIMFHVKQEVRRKMECFT